MSSCGAETPMSRKVRHCPSCVMPTGTMAYFEASRAPMTLSAERSDTSCSPDLPPKRTAIRSFPELSMCPHDVGYSVCRLVDIRLTNMKVSYHADTRRIHR